MKTLKLFSLILFALLLMPLPSGAKSLVGHKFSFQYADTCFQHPFIDVDKVITRPVRCRMIHGGFADGTRFSFYFPIRKADYAGRFFQYITPFPDSETSAQTLPKDLNPISFAITHGSYFVETNEGGRLDLTHASTKKRDASIGAYRANAACAEFSRVVARHIYGCQRPYGYCFGGSGGAYRTVGGMESTQGVWDGAAPFVLGSPQAIPNVFGLRMWGHRMLKDKMDDIVDALDAGGSGDPYATLTAEQRQVLQEVTSMGFPIRSWYGWKYMDVHGFSAVYRSVQRLDPSYFSDFWTKPGYLGYDHPASLLRDRVQVECVVRRIVGQAEAEQQGVVQKMNAEERGSADRAWAYTGVKEERPAAYLVDANLKEIGFGGDAIILSGKGRGQRVQLHQTRGNYVGLSNMNPTEKLLLVKVGDTIQVDNSDFLAIETYHRHQVPTPDYYVWNQFRGFNGVPIYPQREHLMGFHMTRGAAGCLPTGTIHGKMILCCSTYDREAFPWQGDWYRNSVRAHLGQQGERDNFRLWYTDKALHGGIDDSTRIVDYVPTLYQALLDLSDWVERGVEPSPSTDYTIEQGQVALAHSGNRCGGVQPMGTALINGKEKAVVSPDQQVSVNVAIDVPKGTGRIVKAEWSVNGKSFTIPVDLSKATVSDDGTHIEWTSNLKFDKPGTYFPTLRFHSQRQGSLKDHFTMIQNLARVRVVVR